MDEDEQKDMERKELGLPAASPSLSLYRSRGSLLLLLPLLLPWRMESGLRGAHDWEERLLSLSLT